MLGGVCGEVGVDGCINDFLNVLAFYYNNSS